MLLQAATRLRVASTRHFSTAVSSSARAAAVDASHRRIYSLFHHHGNSDYIGEPMSITEHSVQTALAAKKAGETVEVQLACLLHDVGHLAGLEAGHAPGMDGCGTEDHEAVGADFLAALGLPDTVSYLARHHVDAKRYLCAVDPEYHARLSDASRTTLKHQGGPMSAAEVAAAEADPRWPIVLRCRTYDEAGKDEDAPPTAPDFFAAELRALLEASLAGDNSKASPYAPTYVLSPEQLRFWDEFGYLVVRGALDADGVAAAACADELAALKGTTLAASSSLVHHERALDGEVRICRVENFVKDSAHWAGGNYALVEGLVSQAFGEPATLFKDKINYKGPGGGSFLAHQDATAYATDKLASTHISASVAIDPATLENGPLEVAPGRHREGVLPHDAGVIAADAEAAMAFVPALLQPGDVLLFDSFLPHRSAPNTTASWRRSAYLTFNRAAEGDLHAAYYAKKREAFAQGTAGTISINKDFGGAIVQQQ